MNRWRIDHVNGRTFYVYAPSAREAIALLRRNAPEMTGKFLPPRGAGMWQDGRLVDTDKTAIVVTDERKAPGA